MHFVIGAGGVGSWLVPKLSRLEKDITIIDGDTLEEKNLDRQLFDSDDIGKGKAQALASKYATSKFMSEYYHVGLMELDRKDMLWCCADNHACRREVLMACDQYRCRAIIMANEISDFEAYLYEPSMQGTPNDPRMFYPDILTDRTGDPLSPLGCVEAARNNQQLVIANSCASEFGMWLWYFHARERAKMPPDTQPFWPIMHRGNHLAMRTVRWGDRALAAGQTA